MLIGRLPPETAEIDDVALMLFGLLERISADAAQAKNQEPKT
jgi:hypothetical protein